VPSPEIVVVGGRKYPRLPLLSYHPVLHMPSSFRTWLPKAARYEVCSNRNLIPSQHSSVALGRWLGEGVRGCPGWE